MTDHSGRDREARVGKGIAVGYRRGRYSGLDDDLMWHCLLLDLQDDAALIEAYRDRHRAVPPTVLASIRAAGIEAMDIYQRDDRLVMMMRTGPDFDPEAKAAADASDPAVVAWEAAMLRLQRPLPSAQPGEKWLPAERIFALDEQG